MPGLRINYEVIMKIGSKLAITVFSIVALAHLLRLVLGITVTIEDWAVPAWISVLGFFVPGVIAWLLWREARQHLGN